LFCINSSALIIKIICIERKLAELDIGQ